jgi:hypothetical protein
LVLLSALAIIVLILGLGFGLTSSSHQETKEDGKDDVSGDVTISDKVVDQSTQTPPQSKEPVLSNVGTYYKAAVASDGKPCAKIGS